MSCRVSPARFIQIVPNSIGVYHMNPRMILVGVVTAMAGQLRSLILFYPSL